MTDGNEYRYPVFVDCDAGVDDSLALAYLFAQGTHELAGVTTVAGNVTAAQSAANVRYLLSLLGVASVEVVAGSEVMLSGRPADTAELVHGIDGLGDVRNAPLGLTAAASRGSGDAAARYLSARARTLGKLQLVALGPLTNIARLLSLDPEITQYVPRVTIMGGAINHPGNGTAAAEANIRNDLTAAAIVLAANWEVTLVPLDVTMSESFTECDVERLSQARSEAVRFLAGASEIYLSFHEGRHFKTRRGALHDPLAMGIAIGAVVPAIAPRLHVVVDDRPGLTQGATIADTRGQYLGYPENGHENARVILSLEYAFAPKFLESLLSLGSETP